MKTLIASALVATGLAGCAAPQAAPTALAVGAPSTPVAQSGADADGMFTVSGSKVVRTIDCKGGDLTVMGDDATLTVSGCSRLIVPGNRNRIQAQLIPSSTIDVSGASNVVTWRPAEGWSPPVTASGRNNEINPVLSERDSKAVK